MQAPHKDFKRSFPASTTERASFSAFSSNYSPIRKRPGGTAPGTTTVRTQTSNCRHFSLLSLRYRLGFYLAVSRPRTFIPIESNSSYFPLLAFCAVVGAARKHGQGCSGGDVLTFNKYYDSVFRPSYSPYHLLYSIYTLPGELICVAPRLPHQPTQSPRGPCRANCFSEETYD